MSLMYSAHPFAAVPLALLQPGAGRLDRPAYFIDWGPIQISLANLVMIGVGLLLFALAIAIPFPKGRKRP
jgi:hypothetical protein